MSLGRCGVTFGGEGLACDVYHLPSARDVQSVDVSYFQFV